MAAQGDGRQSRYAPTKASGPPPDSRESHIRRDLASQKEECARHGAGYPPRQYLNNGTSAQAPIVGRIGAAKSCPAPTSTIGTEQALTRTHGRNET